jgi:Protein of unknown function (DUF2934)
MSNTQEQQGTKAPGHSGNQGAQQDGERASGQDRQEQYQRAREQAPTDQDGRMGSGSSAPDSENNLGRGAPTDREDRIRQRAYELWEQEGRPDGRAQQHWDRAAQDLDREDADIRREGVAGENPSARTEAESNRKKPDPDRT